MTNRSDSAVFQSQGGQGQAEVASLRWELRRNCALTPRQLMVALGVLCLPCMLIAVGFLWLGLPWVVPFAGLEALAVAAALVAYARHARDGEWVAVDGQQLVWQTVRGQTVENGRADVRGVRVEQGREQGSALGLWAQGRYVEFGRQATPLVRDRFADEFTRALRRAARSGAGSTF